jgi:hypothetical protein
MRSLGPLATSNKFLIFILSWPFFLFLAILHVTHLECKGKKRMKKCEKVTTEIIELSERQLLVLIV